MRSLILVLSLLLPALSLAQSGSSVNVGSSTFFSFDGLSGSSTAIGNSEF